MEKGSAGAVNGWLKKSSFPAEEAFPLAGGGDPISNKSTAGVVDAVDLVAFTNPLFFDGPDDLLADGAGLDRIGLSAGVTLDCLSGGTKGVDDLNICRS